MRPVAFALLLCACLGPPAPDVELCRDVISRLCLGPVCEAALSALTVEPATCEATLLARTGCSDDAFAFSVPTRNRVLECRIPLVRVSTARLVHPWCDDVAEALSTCPDLALFLKGVR
jgi:hypothetical protein